MFPLDNDLRFAIVGKNPLLEDELVARLKNEGAAGSSIVPFDEGSAGTSIDIDENEECRIYLPLSGEYLKDFDALFLVTPSDKARKLIDELFKNAETPVIDLAGDDPSGKPARRDFRSGFVPSPEQFVISEIIRTAGAAKVKSFYWNMFQSASSKGTEGIKELFSQTASVLNFKKPESSVFPGQLSFNILPEAPEPACAVEKAVRELSGFEGFLSRTVIRVSVFHGSSVSFVLEADGKAEDTKKEIVKGLRADKLFNQLNNVAEFYDPEQRDDIQYFLETLGEGRIWGWIRFDQFKAQAELAVRKLAGCLNKRKVPGERK